MFAYVSWVSFNFLIVSLTDISLLIELSIISWDKLTFKCKLKILFQWIELLSLINTIIKAKKSLTENKVLEIMKNESKLTEYFSNENLIFVIT